MQRFLRVHFQSSCRVRQEMSMCEVWHNLWILTKNLNGYKVSEIVSHVILQCDFVICTIRDAFLPALLTSCTSNMTHIRWPCCPAQTTSTATAASPTPPSPTTRAAAAAATATPAAAAAAASAKFLWQTEDHCPQKTLMESLQWKRKPKSKVKKVVPCSGSCRCRVYHVSWRRRGCWCSCAGGRQYRYKLLQRISLWLATCLLFLSFYEWPSKVRFSLFILK